MAFVSGSAWGGGKNGFGAATCTHRSGLPVRMALTTVDTTIKVISKGKEAVEIKADTSLDVRANLKKAGIDIYTLGGKLMNCGGHGSCGLCRVRVLEGAENCGPRTTREEVLAEKNNLPDDIRLACRMTISGPITVQTKPE